MKEVLYLEIKKLMNRICNIPINWNKRLPILMPIC